MPVGLPVSCAMLWLLCVVVVAMYVVVFTVWPAQGQGESSSDAALLERGTDLGSLC